MNIFVLSTGRCGSTTFIKACAHIKNFTAAHESRHGLVGNEHFRYAENHIEADNRLSWFLGRLEKTYGDDAFYVHLTRNRLATAKSYLQRYNTGLINLNDYSIINAYSRNMVGRYKATDPMAVCLDYCDTVNTNIEVFLQNKPNKMNFALENAKNDFQEFWFRIGAEGDLLSALAEWDTSYNKNRTPTQNIKVRRKLKYLMAVLFE